MKILNQNMPLHSPKESTPISAQGPDLFENRPGEDLAIISERLPKYCASFTLETYFLAFYSFIRALF